ncbi:type IV inositol polyphosphate 5-phosphatase 9 [Zea mays]|uniref:Inositol polyphosphate-related phosphatase domain-containing protein n=1 Tax=Zea mays TaxID=4577 RepID=A0A804R915_MAIZE|nr:type IV inositol polyphosphate 5-phosphatase 9 [Zea mays]|eukprot:XP_008660352.1 type IV inositol polyphosphate 5-phosphatase 9 [Zea mays]
MLENQKQAEVLWPRLVANKLFRKTSGSHAFVADFPATDGDGDVVFGGTEFDGGGCSPDPDDADASRCVKRARPQPQPQERNKKTLKYKLFASTWNVGGVAPPDELDLSDWLDGGGGDDDDGPYDMYVLGFQEVVPLRARNVLGADKKRVGMRWIELTRAALNRSSSSHAQRGGGSGGGSGSGDGGGGGRQKVHPVRDGGGGGGLACRDYRCVVSKQMVGVLLTVWVRSDLRRFVRRASVSCVGCGVMGCLGNKGAVSVRFWLHETSFCFVCCHLASGGRDGDEAHRNADATEILSRTAFPRGQALNLPLPHKILDHDRVILLGDLNYRISLPEAKTRLLVERQDWKTLLENDQLRAEVRRGGAFQGWSEGPIAFSPTYKYCPNSDAYYGCATASATADARRHKRRAPAWCDRILWRGEGIRQARYGRCESRLSDHRPVRAVFTVEVGAPAPGSNLNSLRSFFMSERFDGAGSRSPAADQLLRRDDDVNSARFSDAL